MPEGDRPGNGGPSREHERASRLRVYGGGRVREIRPLPASPRDVSRRLSTLERRVERALGGPAAAELARDRLRGLADQLLALAAGAQRLTFRDVRSLVAGWRDLAEDLERDVTAGVLDGLYRYWWRTEAVGLERVPADGPVVVVTNRGGALLPYEALMIRVALATEVPGGRAAHPLIDDWLADLPVLGPALAASGAVRGTPAVVRRLLARAAAVIACPEVGQPKTFRHRYRLAPFGRGTFARVAIEAGAPIVPIAVIGAEEIHPVLARLDLPGRLLGLPTLPITPTFPWFGVAGLVPLPTKWFLLAGEPLDVARRHRASDAENPAAVGRLRDAVRERLQALVLEGLRRRRSVFRG